MKIKWTQPPRQQWGASTRQNSRRSDAQKHTLSCPCLLETMNTFATPSATPDYIDSVPRENRSFAAAVKIFKIPFECSQASKVAYFSLTFLFYLIFLCQYLCVYQHICYSLNRYSFIFVSTLRRFYIPPFLINSF